MPETYAHFSFGKLVYNYLDVDLQNIISKNMDLYNIGVHGPDIFFYNDPFGKNHVKKIGHEQHKVSAINFFKEAKKIINKYPNQKETLSYIAGFISHYMLDTECHPYIRTIEDQGFIHSDVETEFERILMEKDGLSPYSHIPTKHIISKPDYAECISLFYDEIKKDEVLKSLKSMKFILNLLVSLRHIKPLLNNSLIKRKGNEYYVGLIMSKNPIDELKKSNEVLIDLYNKAIIPTAEIINEYYKNLNNEYLNERFDRNFG